MFTGIIEGRGEIKKVTTGSKGFTVDIKTPFDLSCDKVGDSIAVNGICLTVTDMRGNIFSGHVSEETLSRTNLSEIRQGNPVNLERALKAGDRFGGHIVTGHIDGVGKLIKQEQRGESVYLEIRADENILKYTVEKGSIAVDGVSLTVNDVGKDFFSLNIIPHTLEVTTLGNAKTGGRVNLETDILGKYVERLLAYKNGTKGVDMNLLKEYGFA